jgi:hypothetical protein
VSQPVGEIKVRRGIETYGGKGESLVKGVVVNLSAIALSVKPGGSIERVQILGQPRRGDPGGARHRIFEQRSSLRRRDAASCAE